MLERRTGEFPSLLIKETETCDAEKFEAGEAALSLSLYLNGQETQEIRSVTHLLDGLMIRDPKRRSISRVLYGEEIVAARTGDQIYVLSHKSGKDVQICPQMTYGKNSVESAALNTSFFIHQAYEKTQKLLPETHIAPIDLRVGSLVSYEQQVPGRRGSILYSTYDVDNAYYVPQEKSIIFLPHSKKRSGSFAKFWQIPTVANHEYGHHIFASLSPRGVRAGLEGCFGHDHDLIDSAEGRVGTRTARDLETALNEGFSDLFAFYSLLPRERSIQGIPELIMTREIHSPFFNNFQMKTFSEEALLDFFSPKSETRIQTHYAIKHSFGAIFAHRANELLESFTLSDERKLYVLLSWVKEYGKNWSRFQSYEPRTMLDEMLRLFVTTTLGEVKKSLNAETCPKVIRFYPRFEELLDECRL